MESNFRKDLFKLGKNGNVLHFTIQTGSVGAGWAVITRKGYLGGTYQEDVSVAEPKNSGRANETTPEQQALLEATSKFNKLKDKGYKEVSGNPTLQELKKVLSRVSGTDSQGNLLPMLAQKKIEKITFPGYLQRKYDGVRCLIGYRNGELTMRSRNGKFFKNLEHILEDVRDLPLGYQLDGELYCHDRALQDIVSMAKKKQEANKLIKFRAYDIIIPDLPYKERYKELKRVVLASGDNISFTSTRVVYSWDEVHEYCDRWIAAGYEGGMWRDPNTPYEPGTRSWGLIKVKRFLEEDFEIVGINEATGRDAGTGVFVCKTKRNIHFDVRPMGSRELRKDYLNRFNFYKGKLLTIRFQSWTNEGKPFHARGIVVRDYE